MNIYVGNLSYKTSELQLREEFSRYGEVGKINMNVRPLESDAYVFCFVEMPYDNQASAAIRKLNGMKLDGYTLTIKESGMSL